MCHVHGKRSYGSRKKAKRAIRCLHGDAKGMREYWCEESHGWHIGHLSHTVRVGYFTADEVYGSDAA